MLSLDSHPKDSLARHILFWVLVFLYFVLTANRLYYHSFLQIIEMYTMVVGTQIITAYTCLYILIPKFLDKKKYLSFIVLLLLLLGAMWAVYCLFKMWFYDPKYFDIFDELGQKYASENFITRFLKPAVFLSKVIKFLTPTVLLLTLRFYKSQQQLVELREQKKTAELSALKNQLNPHFLFNTLNSLYALSLEKSEKTPEVIARLSDILDYILFRCEEVYVPIHNEVGLIENYLALEKLRYGRRVEIVFVKKVLNDVKVAPLILLTFIENAFKHGVKQEIKEGKIEIHLSTQNNQISFKIKNSKPSSPIASTTKSLGHVNVKKQLELLYPDRHTLEVVDSEKYYEVILTLKTADV